MKKRMTDADIWDDEWFMRLPCEYKLFWRYICDKCSHAGVWKPNFHLAGLVIGTPINDKRVLEILNEGKERIRILPDGLWWLTGFIPFQQHNGLSRKCAAHTPIYKFAEEYNIDVSMWEKDKGMVTLPEPLPNPYDTLSKGLPNPYSNSNSNGSSKELQSNTSVITSSIDQQGFNEFWNLYPSSRKSQRTKDEAVRSWAEMLPPAKDVLKALKWAIGHEFTKDGGQYIPNPVNWLSKRLWLDKAYMAQIYEPKPVEDEHSAIMAPHELRNAWHDKHMPNNVCVFCGVKFKGIGICGCDKYRIEYNKFLDTLDNPK